MTTQDKKGVSRRAFLKGAGMAGLGAAMGIGADHVGAVGVRRATASVTETVPKRPFGKTGVQVSALSLGGMFDIPSNQLVLRQAIRWGVTYWDTADCYGGGKSEKGIGKFFERSPDDRKQIFLVTKSDDRDPEGLSRLLNRSLDRMKTDYVDLYFVHGLGGMDELNGDTKKWAEKAKSEGRIRFFGFSTHRNMEECMIGAAKLGWIDGIMMTYNYRVMNSDAMKRAVAACVEAGIGLTAMKTQAKSSWFNFKKNGDTAEAMLDRFIKRGFTAEQAKLKAVWENKNIASICSQMPNMTILKANTAAAMDKTKLAGADRMLLEQYARETASAYCAGCSGICESVLGGEIPVCDVMRYLMYGNGYGDGDRARRLFRRVPLRTRERMARADYSSAESLCPQGMPIGELMRTAVAELI